MNQATGKGHAIGRRPLLAAAALLPTALRAAGSAPPTQKPTVPQMALVIGNDAYQYSPRLVNAGNDARLMAAVLTELGADSQLLLDQTEAGMREGIAAFSRKAERRGGLAWLYYSGHGVQIGGRNYLQPVDADFRSEAAARARGYDLEKIKQLLRLPTLQAAVVIVDTCRNNPFADTRGVEGLSHPDAMPGMVVAFSTAPYEKALDWKEAGNSPYTNALATALRMRPRTLDTALRETANAVYLRTGRKQKPWYESSLREDVMLQMQGVTLNGLSREPLGRPVPDGATRSAGAVRGYRPDLPRNDAYAGWTGDDWQEADASMMQAIAGMTRRSAASAVAAGSDAHASDAAVTLAASLLDGGRLVAVNPARTRTLYERAAANGYVVAQTLLGEQYAMARPPSFAEAFKWMEQGVRAGYPRAQMNMAQLQLLGQGTTADPAAAGRLLLQSLQGYMKTPTR